MNQHLQKVLNSIQQSTHLSEEEKNAFIKAVKDTDKEIAITEFKLDRTEKVKRTTAILLEETIAELEQKRRAVEEQNKELEIESSLERVRTVAMGMKKPHELLSISEILFKELQALGFSELRNTFIHTFVDEKKYFVDYDFSDITGGRISRIAYNSLPFIENYMKEIRKSDDAITEIAVSGKELEVWKDYRRTSGQMDDPRLDNTPVLYYYNYSVGVGDVGISTFHPITNEKVELLKRFRNVFDLAYRRYIDIQQAEAQARESQVQLALERARAQSMIMQHSKELDDTLRVFHEQVLQLGIHSAFSFLWLPDEEKDRHIFWAAWAENKSTVFKSKAINYPMDRTEPATAQCLVDWKSNQPVISYHVPPEGIENYFIVWSELIAGVEELKPENFREGVYYIEAFMKYGCFGVMVRNELHEEEKKILGRFAIEFERAYTRFLDLQKSEAQAREAQIEAALEKVRSRSLAMHKSDELKEVIKVVLEQFIHLKINAEHAGFYIDYKAQDDMHIWLADPNIEPFFAIIPYFDTPTWNSFLDAKVKGMPLHTDLLNFEEKNNFYQSLFKLFTIPEEAKQFYMQCKGLAVSTVLLDNVGLYIENFSAIPYTDEENNILMRFGKVFQQAYTRFLDLQKAEAQAREAQIEAALERVRSRTMAMHKSSELLQTADLLFEQIKQLGAELQGVAFAICDKNSTMVQKWTSIGVFTHPHNIDPGEERMYEAWKNQSGLYDEIYEGENQKKYYEAFMKIPAFREGVQKFIDSGHPIPKWQKNHAVTFKHGYLLFITTKPFNETQIFLRFGKVFEQTYTRFLDLQKAEAQAKEAQIEAALERVRSRTMAMQKSDELAETSAVLFQQLILLGIEPNRLYICIVENEKGDSDFWITDEDGSKVSMAYQDNLLSNPTFKKMFDGWTKQEKSQVIDMRGEELQLYLKYLNSIHVPFKGGMAQQRRLQYLAYFNKGFIGMASPDEQPEDTLQLLERFASVFNLTFTRFNDLKVAEAHALQAEQDLVEIKAARKKAEEALTELQATQKQLIQSEKMASLGELTAGIAHEIQNPLNFVNNFSEVSNELIQELRVKNEELRIENKEVNELIGDISSNLEKILHHGKRAGDIVKGMLQHSRSSSGQKELTEINTLCDEYLRLAYHGLRAKDKSFNAEFKTDFDETLPKINVVPQDIGRVILNLINNAFYAVIEKKKTAIENYEPTVSLSTRKLNDKIEISVKDNGNGISKNIVDKIFQPFFTTKPTGQGTGLGLSLSYDIVKAHGGKIKVGTKEGEGTEFIIQLPVV